MEPDESRRRAHGRRFGWLDVREGGPVPQLRGSNRCDARYSGNRQGRWSANGSERLRRRHHPLQAATDGSRCAGAGGAATLREGADREARSRQRKVEGGIALPVSFTLAGPVSMTLGPEVDLLADSDG